MIELVFTLWSPVLALTVVLSGVAFGLTLRHLRPASMPYTTAFLMTLLNVFYFAPIVVQRLITPELYDAGLRTIGAMLLLAIFTAAVTVTLELDRRLRP